MPPAASTRVPKLIQEALLNLMEGRTAFVIAHRLSTIRSADHMLVIDGGRLVERGDHESLLAQEGFYNNLYMSQYRRVEGEGALAVESTDMLTRQMPGKAKRPRL